MLPASERHTSVIRIFFLSYRVLLNRPFNFNYFISLSVFINNFIILMCFNSLKFSQGTGLLSSAFTYQFNVLFITLMYILLNLLPSIYALRWQKSITVNI